MYLHALATAVPETSFSQAECATLAQRSEIKTQLTRRSQVLVQAVLRGDSGIQRRHFAVPDAAGVFLLTADQLNEAFRKEAPRLASTALGRALGQAGLGAGDVDALIICTCTGYLCPGVSSYVAEGMGIRSDALLHDLAGLGCGAAIPMLRTADAFLRAQPDAVVATVAVEICSAAFYLDDDPGVLISACLFGDGAAAAIWRSMPGPGKLRCHSFTTHHDPRHRDKIRFEQRNGKLRNLLDGAVPGLAAEVVSALLNQERGRSKARPIARVLAHPGGRDVVNAIEKAVPEYPLDASRRVLRDYGNMSSPSVLFVLNEALREGGPAPDEDWWLVAFGAGFSAHGCRIGA